MVGPRALNPQNIAWLGAGDPAAHYLGWLFYRDSEWEFPVGLNPSYGLEIAGAILYPDSNPLLALIFKSFSFLLPRVFPIFRNVAPSLFCTSGFICIETCRLGDT